MTLKDTLGEEKKQWESWQKRNALRELLLCFAVCVYPEFFLLKSHNIFRKVYNIPKYFVKLDLFLNMGLIAKIHAQHICKAKTRLHESDLWCVGRGYTLDVTPHSRRSKLSTVWGTLLELFPCCIITAFLSMPLMISKGITHQVGFWSKEGTSQMKS